MEVIKIKINMIKYILPLLCFFSVQLTAQNYCGTTELDENWISYYHANKQNFQYENENVLYIPIQVHVLRTDEGEGEISFIKLVKSLNKLNLDFEPTGIRFYLVRYFNYIDKTKWYDHSDFNDGAEMIQTNNVSDAINCYIVKNPAGNCGYYSPRQDGLVLGTGCIGGGSATWAHEMGHLLSLPHTFYGTEGVTYTSTTDINEFKSMIWGTLEKVDGSNCTTAGDRFCDTKPDYLSYRWNCNSDEESFLLQTDENRDTFRSNGAWIMSYSNDACASAFSLEQTDAMIANLRQKRTSINRDTTPESPDLENDIVLLNPEHEGDIHYQGMRLEWSPVMHASYYYVEISRRSSFSGNSTIRSIVQEPFIDIAELSLDKKYYIHVMPFNLSSWALNFSETYNFRTTDLTSSTKDQFNNNRGYNISNLIYQGDPVIVYNLKELNEISISYEIINMAGIRVDSGKMNIRQGESNAQITVNHPKGVYLLQLKGNSDPFPQVYRFVIQ